MDDDARPTPLEPTSAVTSNPPARLPHAPRLTIRYTLLVTAVTAVVLTVLSQRIGEPQRQHIWPVLVLAAVASLLGWGYSAVLLIAWHKLRRTLWRLEPGEWLLLCAANVATMWIAGILLKEWLLRWHFDGDPYSYAGFVMTRRIDLFVPGEMAAVYLIAAVAQRKQVLWCAALVGAALYLASFYVRRGWIPTQILLGLWVLVNCGILLLLVTGVVADSRARRPRHWIHWSGVAITGCAVITMGTLQVWALSWW